MPDTPIRRLREIRRGVRFTQKPGQDPDGEFFPGQEWEVVSKAKNVFLESIGQNVPIENSRNNKWYCRKVGEKQTHLCCFDENSMEEFNFRIPAKESPAIASP